MRVAICIATYQRPRMLAALLRSLESLQLPVPAPELAIVVVDNDAAGSAAPVLQAARAAARHPLYVAQEPARNIALARNRGVAVALQWGADWVAFIDDDETADPAWLAALLRAATRFRASVVAGPVVNAYLPGTPAWATDARVQTRVRHATGTPLATAETGNSLVARAVLEGVPGPFDPTFGRTGGSDSVFFHRAHHAGARIVWCDDAVVYETVPASRATMGWLLRRAFRVGNSTVLVARGVLPAWRWLPRRLAAAAYRLGLGLLQLPLALVHGRVGVVRASQNLSLSAGALAAMVGVRYREYERSHGA